MCVLLALGAPVGARAALPAGDEASISPGTPEAAPSPGGFQGFASPSEVPEWARGKPIEFYVPPEQLPDRTFTK